MKVKELNIFDILIVILTALLFASFIVFNKSVLSSSGVLIIAFVLLFVHVIKRRFVFDYKLYNFQILVLVFIFYCFLSSLWSTSASDAITKGRSIFKILICATIVYICHKDFKDCRPLIQSIILGGYIITIYYFLEYGSISLALFNASSGIRDNVEFANLNAVGRILSISILVNMFTIVNSERKLPYLAVIFPIIALISTQSRMPFIQTLFGIVVMLFLNSVKKKNVLNFLARLAIYTLLVIILIIVMQRIPSMNGIMTRLDGVFGLFNNTRVDNSTLVRKKMIELGIQLFKESPIVGIGIGNAHLYSDAILKNNAYLHNNYAELLADGGIVGFFLYYQIHLDILIKTKKSKIFNDFTILCITIILTMMVSDIAGVSYYVKETYFYFVFCYLLLEKNIENNDSYFLDY